MNIINKFKNLFFKKGQEIDYFRALQKFDEKNCSEYIKEFYIEFEPTFLNYWDLSDEEIEKYLKHIEVFARADGTGGQYAFWFADKTNRDRNNSPIICYGSEGNMNIVASNIRDLIQMLSCGAEGLDGSFYLSHPSIMNEKEYREYFINNYPLFYEFRDWMQEEFGIEPIKEWWEEGSFELIEELQEKANKEYKDSYETFNKEFFPDYYSYFDEQKEEEENKKLENLKKEETLLQKIKTEPQIQDYFDLIDVEYEKEITDYQKQIEYTSEIFKFDPNNKEAKENLINIYQNHLKNYEKALILLLEFEKEYPEETNYLDIGNCYRKLQQYDKAFEYFEKRILKDYNENIGKKNFYESDIAQKWIVDTAKEGNLNPIAILEDIASRIPSAKTFEYLTHLTFRENQYKKSVDYFIKERKLSTDQQVFRYIEYLEKLYDNKAYDEGIRAGEFSLLNVKSKDRLDEIYCYIGLFYKNVEPCSEENLKKAIIFYEKAIKLDENEEIYKNNLEFAQKKLKKIQNIS